MKKKLHIFLVLLIFSLCVQAQNYKRAYKHLEKAEYAKAKEILDKISNELAENPTIFFGYMIIYADKLSSFYNPLEAYNYSRKLFEKIDLISKEDMDLIAEYFSNTETVKSSLPIKKKILHAIGTIESDLIKYLREENNIELIKEAIERFPDYKYYNNLIHIRNQYEFRKYEKLMTLEGFEEFLQKYPDAAQRDKAIKYRNKLAFERAMNIYTEEAFDEFIKKYPDADEYYEAIKMRNKLAFEKAKKLNTIEAMEAFKKKYPDALEIGEANNRIQKLLYEKAKSIQSLDLLNEFLKRYPEGIYYVDIFNIKAKTLGEKYCQQFFNYFGIDIWCRCFDFSNSKETPGGMYVFFNNNYLIGANTIKDSSNYADGWLLKLNPEGKMLWNITLGEQFDDKIYKVITNGNNEVLALSLTQIDSNINLSRPWLFKINEEGKKIWSRNIGDWSVDHILVNSLNDIILGGYVIDSIYTWPKVMYLNNNGKRVWERIYSVKGKINGMQLFNDNRLLISSGKWLSLLDQKGYILWEKEFSDSIRFLIPAKEDLTIIIGKIDSINYSLIMFNAKDGGKMIWRKNLSFSPNCIIKNIYVYDGNSIYLNVYYYKDIIMKFDYSGNLLKTIEFPPELLLYDLKIDNSSNFIMQFLFNDDILIVKSAPL